MNKNSKNFDCELCSFYATKLSNLMIHNATRKHQDSIKFNEKKGNEYFCKLCNVICVTILDLRLHNQSQEHRKNLKKVNDVNEKHDCYKCDHCAKEYKSNNSLWYHKKKCNFKQVSDRAVLCEPAKVPLEILIFDIIKENQEFKNLLIEQQKENNELLIEQQKENKELMNKMVEIAQQQLTIPTTVINNPTMNNTTNNNQTFNLQLFLNETCKDAMNIQEFIENVKITFEELLVIGNSGFVNGISDIFIKQLRDLEINKRPIHCTDSKRETIYLKEQDSWNKDDKDKTKLKQIIEKIEYKNVAALHTWCNEHPDAKVNNTPNNLLKDKIFYQTLQGDEKTRDKIIKNISKEVTIEKQGVLLEN
jgi:hypothetical protein